MKKKRNKHYGFVRLPKGKSVKINIKKLREFGGSMINFILGENND